jgi:hypothetical protein
MQTTPSSLPYSPRPYSVFPFISEADQVTPCQPSVSSGFQVCDAAGLRLFLSETIPFCKGITFDTRATEQRFFAYAERCLMSVCTRGFVIPLGRVQNVPLLMMQQQVLSVASSIDARYEYRLADFFQVGLLCRFHAQDARVRTCLFSRSFLILGMVSASVIVEWDAWEHRFYVRDGGKNPRENAHNILTWVTSTTG